MAANFPLSAIRLSANLGFLWSELPLLERIAAAGRAGFRSVEFHLPYATPPARVKAACAATGVAVTGINTPYGNAAAGEFGLGALPGRQDDFLRLFDTAAAYADAIGANAIHVLAGNVPAAERGAATETFVRNLGRASRMTPDGVTLLLEAMNRQDRPEYLLSTTAEADAVRAAVGANVKLMFDAYHVGRDGRDVAAEFARYLPHIAHVQIAAVPSRAEPDEGTLDYGVLLQTIAASGYRGWIGAEYKPRAGTDAGLIWRAKLGL